MLGLGWFRMKEQISAFSEFCNVGARPVYALSFFKFSGKSILMLLHRGVPRAPTVRWALRWLERKRLMAEILRGMPSTRGNILLRRQIEDRRHYASCVTGAGVLF